MRRVMRGVREPTKGVGGLKEKRQRGGQIWEGVREGCSVELLYSDRSRASRYRRDAGDMVMDSK